MTRIAIAAVVAALWALVVGQTPIAAQDPAPGNDDPAAQPANPNPNQGNGSNPDGATNGANRGNEFASDLDRMITQEGKDAVARALKFIADNQNADGSFGQNMGQNYSIAVSALAGLALVAGGHLPGRGPYGDKVLKTINFFVNNQSDTGFFTTSDDRSRTHGHGFATLFLAQVMGMLNDDELHMRVKTAITKAVQITESSQTEEGGWGYVPDDRTWDEASTTVTLVQGLRAARDAGIRVDRRVVDNAVRYVHRCAIRVDWTDKDGNNHVGYTFRYSLRYQNTRSTFPLTAAAISVLHGTGRYEGEVLEGGLDWLNGFYHDFMQSQPNVQWYERFYYYSHFYAAQAFFHAPDPRMWANYYPKVRDDMIRKQNRNGSWPSPYGEVYGTAIAALVLQIPYGYLPIFQK